MDKIKKNRVTQEIQQSLLIGEKPWMALDFNSGCRNWLQLGFGRQQVILDGSISYGSSGIGIQVSLSKQKTNAFLSRLGFPVPKQHIVRTAEEAVQASHRLDFPVVLKSDVGAYGDRVYADLRNEREVTEAFNVLQNQLKKNNLPHSILVESFVPGNVYRVEVVLDRFFDAYHMIPASIVGDGMHTIRELVRIENSKTNRGDKSDPTARYIRLQLGKTELMTLKKENLSPESIPPKGAEIRLRANSNWSSGGTFRQVSQKVHPDNIRLAEQIASAFKIDLIGIDLITRDISKSYIDEDLMIVEVNHSPAILGYFDETTNEHVAIADKLIGRLLPDIAYGDVPVIIFKEITASSKPESLFDTVLNRMGYNAGLINENGFIIDGEIFAKPQYADYQDPGLQILGNNTVGAAIVSRKLQELADYGTGSGGVDISVILNTRTTVIKTPLWPYGIESRTLDRFLCSSARLSSIILIDSAESLDLAKRCPQNKLFALFTNRKTAQNFCTESEINHLSILGRDDKSVLIEIVYYDLRCEKSLKIDTIQDPAHYMALIAALLVLNHDLEEIWSAIES